MNYKVSKSWYWRQFLAALPLALLALIFYQKGDAPWLISTTALVFLIYCLLILFRIYKQKQSPIICTSDAGIQVNEYGFNSVYIPWQLIHKLEYHWYGIRLIVVGRPEKIPISALSQSDKQRLLEEINRRIE